MSRNPTERKILEARNRELRLKLKQEQEKGEERRRREGHANHGKRDEMKACLPTTIWKCSPKPNFMK
ncbi:hypothetical protein NQ317_017571 [Molorchus minor]|uniref:Uncharacterized protein n=1 Tax=Molorchus minor TaxID=1323400 RepID=A0ABQ9IR35_9CUCU|nr:hypothetical protein NQ317_017571 [Molorchus minor]